MAWLLNNQTQRQTFWGPLMAGAIITSVPVVVFFLIIQKNIATGDELRPARQRTDVERGSRLLRRNRSCQRTK